MVNTDIVAVLLFATLYRVAACQGLLLCVLDVCQCLPDSCFPFKGSPSMCRKVREDKEVEDTV